jgi:RNA polymerase sigma-70 factor (ECF subfamily)
MKIVDTDAVQIQTIAQQFRTEIFAYIQSRVRDSAAADDLTQETLVKVNKALTKGAKPDHFRGWLFQIARNSVIDFLKEAGRFVPFREIHEERGAAESKASDSIDNEFRERLFSYTLRVIETLPEDDRDALRFTELDGLSREELARELGISISGAKSRVQRARAKLRQAVQECCRLITDPYGRVIDWEKRGSPSCCPDESVL